MIFFIFLNFNREVVAAEKIHQSLLTGVEHFDKATMKHTTTEEKNPLPPVEGLSSPESLIKNIKIHYAYK